MEPPLPDAIGPKGRSLIASVLKKSTGKEKNMARIWTDGPHVHEGETCPVCHEENLHFRQYQELDDGTVEEVYFCYYCDDYIRFYP